MENYVKQHKMLRLLVILIVAHTIQALECGIHIHKNEELIDVLSRCLKANKTLDLYDVSESEDSAEDTKPAPIRNRRFTLHSQTLAYADDQNNATTSGESGENSTDSAEKINCVVQCIFHHLEMTDTNGFPDHTKILESLIKPATGREFRDFIQDTTDECFRDIESEVALDSCDFSTKLVTCLALKGKANCADWPVGDLPFKTV